MEPETTCVKRKTSIFKLSIHQFLGTVQWYFLWAVSFTMEINLRLGQSIGSQNIGASSKILQVQCSKMEYIWSGVYIGESIITPPTMSM